MPPRHHPPNYLHFSARAIKTLPARFSSEITRLKIRRDGSCALREMFWGLSPQSGLSGTMGNPRVVCVRPHFLFRNANACCDGSPTFPGFCEEGKRKKKKKNVRQSQVTLYFFFFLFFSSRKAESEREAEENRLKVRKETNNLVSANGDLTSSEYVARRLKPT